MNGGGDAEGSEGCDHAATGETEHTKGPVWMKDGDACGEDIEDAVGGAGSEAQFADDDPVLGEAESIFGFADLHCGFFRAKKSGRFIGIFQHFEESSKYF